MKQPAIESMVQLYHDRGLRELDIVREVLQQCALLGLARLNFFEHAAFYGGTALRILYGLDRMSEDLDFSLLTPNSDFDFSPYLSGLTKELASLGFPVQVEEKKNAPPVKSAFVKANTQQTLLIIGAQTDDSTAAHSEAKIKIKLEMDTDPPLGFSTESKLVLLPTPFKVLTYSLPDLFAGKMHAILCRQWRTPTRVKGRDWYDLVWFVKQQQPVRLAHLTRRMQQSGHLEQSEPLSHAQLISLLKRKIAQVDWDKAREDIQPFVADPRALDIWSAEFFSELAIHIKSV